MIDLKTPVPDGVLLGGSEAPLLSHMQAEGGVWFKGRKDDFETEDIDGAKVPTAWHSVTGDKIARPAQPNTGLGRLVDQGSSMALSFHKGKNGGFTVPGIADTALNYSVAVVFRSPTRNAKTIVSVGTETGENFFFVNEVDGQIDAKDRSNGIGLQFDRPALTLRSSLLVLSVSPKRIRVKLGLDPMHEARGSLTKFDAPAELFIGCRNHRTGLAKTLGDHSISDVMYIPDRHILSPEGKAHAPLLSFLEDYWRWTCT